MDLNRPVGDDTAYDFIRQVGDEPVDIDYRLAIRDLMVDIVHINGNSERKKKVMEAYYAYGEYTQEAQIENFYRVLENVLDESLL